MTSPTLRASNVWPIDGGDDILQIIGQGGTVLGGITAGGSGFGALAGGGTPGGATTQLQYNNAGVFGGIAESEYISGASPAIAIFSPTLTFEVASGATESNVVEVTPSTVAISAIDSGSTLQLTSDGDTNITSNNGNVALSASGILTLGGTSAQLSVTGRFNFVSSATTPEYNFSGLSVFANNAAAIAGGLINGDLYRTGADPDVVCIVH